VNLKTFYDLVSDLKKIKKGGNLAVAAFCRTRILLIVSGTDTRYPKLPSNRNFPCHYLHTSEIRPDYFGFFFRGRGVPPQSIKLKCTCVFLKSQLEGYHLESNSYCIDFLHTCFAHFYVMRGQKVIGRRGKNLHPGKQRTRTADQRLVWHSSKHVS
jgi:hypothetical protein